MCPHSGLAMAQILAATEHTEHKTKVNRPKLRELQFKTDKSTPKMVKYMLKQNENTRNPMTPSIVSQGGRADVLNSHLIFVSWPHLRFTKTSANLFTVKQLLISSIMVDWEIGILSAWIMIIYIHVMGSRGTIWVWSVWSQNWVPQRGMVS